MAQPIRFRTVLPRNPDQPTDERFAVRYVEYDAVTQKGAAYYCNVETGERIEEEPLTIGSQWEYHWRLAQWVEQGDTITPGWE